ncbi:MAG: hypothetical protein V5A46_10520 [Haloferacaceae archaeon]
MEDITGLEGELRSNGISVESFEANGTVELTYMTAFPGEELDRGEVGRVCRTFIDLSASDRWDPVRVNATVVRTPGDVMAHWHAEPAWFDGVAGGDLSEVEFSTRVVETITYSDSDSPPDGNGGSADP